MPVSAWSIPRAERSVAPRGSSLGPGEYNAQRPQRQQPPSYSVPRAAPQTKTNGVPGPGNYPEADQNWSKAKTAAPQFTMRPKPELKVENNVPGPIYDPKPIGLKNAPNYTMRPKTALDKKLDTPGPGNYQPTVDSSKPIIIANVRFGKEERKGLAATNATPGPGNYDVSFKEISGPKYHMGLKTEPPSGKIAVPGPGSYPLKTLFEVNVEKVKGNSLVPRRPASAAASQAPGPGAYETDPRVIKQRAPKFAFGKSVRDGLDKEAGRVPGPGNYEINQIKYSKINPQLKGTAAPAYNFGKSIRSDLSNKNDVPGPGLYDYLQPPGKDAPKYVIAVRPTSGQGAITVPGPGHYNPSVEQSSKKQSAPKIRMGTSQRDGLYRTTETPGPGVYYQRPESGKEAPRISFGKEKRMEPEVPIQGPTSTSYQIKSIFEYNREHAKGTTIISRRPLSAASTASPGPGAYSSEVRFVKKNTQNIRFGTQSRFGGDLTNSEKQIPGPGGYDSHQVFIKNTNAPRAVFGKSSRGSVKTAEEPGPGAYEFSEVFNSTTKRPPSYYIGQKLKFKDGETTPAPGFYQPSYNLTRGRVVGSALDKAYRTEPLRPQSAVVGPGFYEVKDKIAGPYYGFGTSERSSLRASDAPGPGAYNIPPKFNDVPSYLLPAGNHWPCS